ncbi:LysR substrate-binding domain-containing protein [Shewanella sp.]|uniref:LysR family transcriptional regulator n=1 Tax=Shewanella sp. TaxID=50422 RepID=UPI003A899071
MDLIDGLKAFVATAQTGSFTDAAEQLGISNRLTSKYVAQLEEKLGVLLLQRTTRKVGVTPSGQELLAKAPAILDELDELLGSISDDSQGLTGVLRIAAPVTFGELFISDILSRFSTLHPKLAIDLRLSDEHVDLAKEGFDLAFRVGEPDIVTLKARKLGEITSLLVASADYLSKNKAPETPADLKMHTCIVDTNRRDARRWSFYKDAEEYTFAPSRNLLVNSARIAKEWALNGRGIALCPSFVLQAEIESKMLTPLLSDYAMKTSPLYAVYLSHNLVPKKVRALIDFAIDDFRNKSC